MKVFKKILISIILIIVCLLLFFLCIGKKETPDNNTVLLSDSYQREAYLNLKGWDVTLISEDEIKIPESFNGIYKNYAQIQTKQKLPLKDFCGKNVRQFLYNVENYGNSFPVYAELLIHDNQLIAAALIEQQPNGFIKNIY